MKAIPFVIAGALALACQPMATVAQTSAGERVLNGNVTDDSTTTDGETARKASRLHIGGYGEVAYSRNFYSDRPRRYSNASTAAQDPSHGRFDIPHAVIYLGYDFGRGWSFGTEIEFEHGGAGTTIEQETEEAAEWEREVEKGGEVELEQFWIQKSFGPWANIRAGHIVVPVGLTNAHHEPLNFFTVYRPEGERIILPCTWHQTGVSFWGRAGQWRYELQMLSGLDAFQFNRENWIGNGANSPYEFEVANKYGFAARVDNYSVPGLRIGLSGYYGQTMHNAYPHDMETDASAYKNITGTLWLGALDFTYNAHNIIARGNIDYGYVSDATTISQLKANTSAGDSPYEKQGFGSHAMAASVEVGYDVLSLSPKLSGKQRLFVFAHYEHYDSFIGSSANFYTRKNILAGGINYMPVPQVCVKAEYNHRFLDSRYNDEPAINIGIAYEGFFL